MSNARIHVEELLPGAFIRVTTGGIRRRVLSQKTYEEDERFSYVSTDQGDLFLPRRRLVYLEGAVI